MNKPRNTASRILENAVLGLEKWETGQANVDDFLNFHLPEPELRRSISSLLFEYFRHKGIVDKILDALISTPCKPEYRRILSAAVTQILYQDGIAAASAVNVAVDFAKKKYSRQSGGFINAVLRNVTRINHEAFDASLTEAERSGLPERLYQRWLQIFPEHIAGLSALLQQRAIMAFRACRDPLTEAEMLELEATPIPSEGFHFYRTENIAKLLQSSQLASGRIYIQDAATALAPMLAGIRPDDRVADLCAAPGGKSLMILEKLGEKGELVVADRSATRQKLTAQNLSLRGYQNPILMLSALEPPFEDESFEVIFLDVPCSNSGVFHRRPDVLWTYSDNKIAELTELQMNMLKACARLVKQGGRIVYSTCSIEPEENGKLVRQFASEFPAFHLQAEKQLIPDPLHDGAYAAVLVKN